MATRLFVGNLPENTDETQLRNAFCTYGEIASLDIKAKPAAGEESTKKFAFVTLSASNYDIESCIKHFSNEDFNGERLYVTRARESFLERLQRERQQAQQKEAVKEIHESPKKNPVIKLGDKLNPRKRKIENDTNDVKKPFKVNKHITDTSKTIHDKKHFMQSGDELETKNKDFNNISEEDKKKHDSEKKRIESMKKKRQEFREKQMIIKTGLTGIDKVANKKVIFFDNEDDPPQEMSGHSKSTPKPNKKNTLFDDGADTDDEVNFEIKEQFEGKKGQKVLDLQSRYKSDKRFILDERFIEDEQTDTEKIQNEEDDKIEVRQIDEKNKQLDILQDVLGVAIRRKIPEEDRDSKKIVSKLGMLRFDPHQPDHAKYLAPVEEKPQESTKKSKKKKDKQTEPSIVEEQKPEEPRPEVSKEQFYKVSETLKEAIAQPTQFSLRSLFGSKEGPEEGSKQQDETYIPLDGPKKPKVKNPLDPREKNPFVYDSSDSETEEVEKGEKPETAPEPPVVTETKAVWKENLFFTATDQRLKDGLAFFNSANEIEAHKERRELKSLVKKRIYNKERKNQMFQKKIGGRRKTMKKSFRKKS